uniref:Uncharacterized protein n=1 Tax=Panagrolaimus sp. ES5 TaxID=591445 RepID=A0AC34G509_9BILA
MPVIIVIDIYGTVHWVTKGTSIELMPLLNEKKGHLKDGLLELVASDTSLIKGKTDDFYVASCWVINDEFFVPIKYFAAFFKITDGEAELWKKFDLTNAPTYCRLTMTSPLHSNELYFLIFSHSIEARTFAINHSEKSLESIESIGDVFPVLDVGSLPGAAIKSHCWIAQGYRFSVVGFDTGYVMAAVCTMESGTIIDRKAIKFSGPISVLKLIDRNDELLETGVFVSSSIGPAVLWSLRLEDEFLQWKIRSELQSSECCDSIISGNTNSEFVFIGTYTEVALILEDVLKLPIAPVISEIHVGSPILSIQYIPADDSIIILSYKGVHKFVQPKNRTFEAIINLETTVDSITEFNEKIDLTPLE